MDTKRIHDGNTKGSLPSYFCRELEDRSFLGYRVTLAFELAPIVDVNGDPMNQDRPWWTNGYTAGWNPLSPLYLGGVMALVGSAIGAACAILTKIPTAEIRIGLHGFNQVLVMIADD